MKYHSTLMDNILCIRMLLNTSTHRSCCMKYIETNICHSRLGGWFWIKCERNFLHLTLNITLYVQWLVKQGKSAKTICFFFSSIFLHPQGWAKVIQKISLRCTVNPNVVINTGYFRVRCTPFFSVRYVTFFSVLKR